MRVLRLGVILVCSVMSLTLNHDARGSGVIVSITSVPLDVCRGSTLTGHSFTSALLTYQFSGFCDLLHTRYAIPITVPWTAIGTYEPSSGKVTEEFNIPEPTASQPSRPFGKFHASMHCGGTDPWRNGTTGCSQMALAVNPPLGAYPPTPWGQYSQQVIGEVLNMYPRAGRPITSNLPNDQRNSLFAEYQAYLQNNQRVQKSLQPAPTLLESLAPSVASPTAGSLFLSMTSVPIKLYPPRRTTVTMYTVKVERKDSRGAWTFVTNLPVSPAQASSPSGYVGWGTGGPDGRSLPLMASPGTYRISAQVSTPLQTGWSQGVEFVVTAPNKAIQRAPKAFGQ